MVAWGRTVLVFVWGEKMVEAIHGLVYSSREDLKFPAAQMRSKGNGQLGWNQQ